MWKNQKCNGNISLNDFYQYQWHSTVPFIRLQTSQSLFSPLINTLIARCKNQFNPKIVRAIWRNIKKKLTKILFQILALQHFYVYGIFKILERVEVVKASHDLTGKDPNTNKGRIGFLDECNWKFSYTSLYRVGQLVLLPYAWKVQF